MNCGEVDIASRMLGWIKLGEVSGVDTVGGVRVLVW